MKKNCIENHFFASQLESRLNKHRYLSKQSLPGANDAKIFDFIKQSSKIPDKQLYPNIYHWYILICQFSDAARAKWISKDIDWDGDEDTLITLCTKEYEGRSNERQSTTSIKQLEDNKLEKTQSSRVRNSLKQQINDMQYFLNICSKNDINQRLTQFKTDYQKQNQFQIILQIVQVKIENSPQGTLYYTNLKVKSSQCQTLKNAISGWMDTVTIAIKKQKRTPYKHANQSNL